jgi:pimeloyl-ACP methyl ester carboxylesterase
MAVSPKALEIQDKKFHALGFRKYEAYQTGICSYGRLNGEGPILILIHGYPQSSYMWRHIISHLPKNMPIFVADLPGYGASPPLEKHDKLSVGTALLNAMEQAFYSRFSRKSSARGDLPVVLVGHDRGARIAHRLAVSGVEGFRIEGVCLIDIVSFSSLSYYPEGFEVEVYTTWGEVSLLIWITRSPLPPNGLPHPTPQK